MRFRTLVSLIAVVATVAWADGIGHSATESSSSPGEIEQYLLGLRSQVAASGDHGLVMELDTQIARAQGLQGHFDQAEALLATVAADLRPDEREARALYELELGRVLMTQGDPAAAVPHFQRALDAAKTAKRDALAVDAEVMLAVTDPDPAQQIAKSQIALRMAKGSADPAAQRWVASILNNIGAAYDDRRQYGDALDAFEKSRAACATDACRRIANWKIAHVKLELGKIAEAQTILRALERQWSAVGPRKGPPFDVGDGKEYVYEELGKVHLALAEQRDRASIVHSAPAHESAFSRSGSAGTATNRSPAMAPYSANPMTGTERPAQAKPGAGDQERAAAKTYFAKAYAEMTRPVGSVAPSLVDQARLEGLKQLAE
jgi:tetratricopeptide (TPR) repeat protein